MSEFVLSTFTLHPRSILLQR